jgi:hypothetical protein
MAREPKTFANSMQDVDQYNRVLFNEMTDTIEEHVKTIDDLEKTLAKRTKHKLKTARFIRRRKRAMEIKDQTIERLETDNTELKTENDELQTQNIELKMDTEQNTIDFSTITKRLADHSCPYCGTPTPSTASTGTETPVTINKHFMG